VHCYTNDWVYSLVYHFALVCSESLTMYTGCYALYYSCKVPSMSEDKLLKFLNEVSASVCIQLCVFEYEANHGIVVS